jgi:hypothetical protein
MKGNNINIIMFCTFCLFYAYLREIGSIFVTLEKHKIQLSNKGGGTPPNNPHESRDVAPTKAQNHSCGRDTRTQ